LVDYLFQFNVHAQYASEDPEFGTEATNVSGEEAYARYSSVAGDPFVE
jgi:hypothetical protein